jgi:hypothetical protein
MALLNRGTPRVGLGVFPKPPFLPVSVAQKAHQAARALPSSPGSAQAARKRKQKRKMAQTGRRRNRR